MKENNNITKIFASRLYSRRVAQGFNQAELAAKVGVSQSTLSKLEAGTCEPNYTVLVQLAVALDCSIDYLLGNADVKENTSTLQINLNAEERSILSRLWKLSVSDREKVISYCQFLESQSTKDKIEQTA